MHTCAQMHAAKVPGLATIAYWSWGEWMVFQEYYCFLGALRAETRWWNVGAQFNVIVLRGASSTSSDSCVHRLSVFCSQEA